jgi:hypothetical protein
MRALVALLAWLAIRAGANVAPAEPHWAGAPLISAAARAAEFGPVVRPDRAGRLVPVPEETLEPNRPLAHWALLAAIALVVLIVGAGYLRRRWKAHAQGTRPPRPAWERNSGRKS